MTLEDGRGEADISSSFPPLIQLNIVLRAPVMTAPGHHNYTLFNFESYKEEDVSSVTD